MQVQKLLTGEKEAAQLDIDVKNGGLASLFFINCEAGMPASFAVKVEQYNLIGDPERKDYLAVGETELDIMFWVRVSCATDMHLRLLLSACQCCAPHQNSHQQRVVHGRSAPSLMGRQRPAVLLGSSWEERV